MITLNSTPEEIYKEFHDCRERALRWYDKTIAHKSWQNDENDKKVRRGEITPGMIYNSVVWHVPGKNKWSVVARFGGVINNILCVDVRPICYWDTFGSVGAACKLKNDDRIILFTGHFFQRYCEREGIEMEGIKTVEEFMNSHLAVKGCKMLEDKKFELHFNGGVGYGVIKDLKYGIYELRTWLPENHLCGKKKQKHDNIELKTEAEMQEKNKLVLTAKTCDIVNKINSRNV